jgi:starch phosphorylase
VNVRARVALGQLKPDDIKVQLMVGRIGTSRELLSPRPVEMAVEEAGEGYAVFQGAISADEPGHWGFSVRIAPFHPDVNVPSELGLVRWEG